MNYLHKYSPMMIRPLPSKMSQDMKLRYLVWFKNWKNLQEELGGFGCMHQIVINRLNEFIEEKKLSIIEEEKQIFGDGENYIVDFIAVDSQNRSYGIELGCLVTTNPYKKIMTMCQQFDFVAHIRYQQSTIIYSKTMLLPLPPPELDKDIATWIENQT